VRCGVGRGIEETTAGLEELGDEFDICVREIFEEDFKDMKDDVMWCNPEFSQLRNITNIQKSRVRKRLLPLQPSKVTVQLAPNQHQPTKVWEREIDTSSMTSFPMSGIYRLNVAINLE
jgi:hypothetical protein